jgi:hypothetical protein
MAWCFRRRGHPGRFVLDGKRQHFIDLPVLHEIGEGGSILLLAHVDFTEKIYGITTARGEGTWSLIIEPGTLRAVEPGLLYLYGIARPALRLTVVGEAGRKTKPKPPTIVLSFPTRAAADEMVQELQQLVRVEPAVGLGRSSVCRVLSPE